MSWKDSIRKQKFQGPPQKHSHIYGSDVDLKNTIRSVDFFLGKVAENLEKIEITEANQLDVRLAKRMLKNAQKEIDVIDSQVLEQEKYSGKTKYRTPPALGERIDSEAEYSGTKYQGPVR
jgi:hypothetical protein|tara:strand:- start:16608 stop:16967 length:360 start_codon:yes stop_codon:yes gene_type:complete